MKKIIYLLLILCLFPCYKENDNNYVFLAKDAYFYNCQVVEDKGIGNINKGSNISFGINSSLEIEKQKIIINLTCPLLWIDDGPYPTSASFKDLYFVTLNDEEIKIDNIISPNKEDITKYNYWAKTSLDFYCKLNKGDNILSFNCIASSNNQVSYFSSVGNFIGLEINTNKVLKEFKPNIDNPIVNEVNLSIDKKTYLIDEEINVSFVNRIDHPKDRIALFKNDDILGKDNPIYYFYPSKINEKVVNIIGLKDDKRVNENLNIGKYKICYLLDDGFEAIKSVTFSIIEEELMTVNKEIFHYKEEILVTAKQRNGQTKDWIALYLINDSIGKIGSLYFFYPSEEISTFDITKFNPNQERDIDLKPNKYKICFLADDGYMILQEIEIEIVA